MNNDSTIGQLKSLKLFGMAKRYETELSLPVHQREDTQALLGTLVQAETEYRNTRRTERYLKASKLRYNALPEDIECSVERGITRDQFIGLLDGSYIEAGGNVLISGATGVGKSYIACALGRNACLLGYRTLYFRMNKFLEMLSQVRVEGTYIKWLKQINRHQLLIFDDFGLKPLTHDARLTILDILEDRYAGAATIFTSQLPVEKWHEYIDEPTLADAIVDRLTASAHRLELRGKSWRNRKKN